MGPKRCFSAEMLTAALEAHLLLPISKLNNQAILLCQLYMHDSAATGDDTLSWSAVLLPLLLHA